MTATYEANIEGALEVLVDILRANSVTMAREPYAPNFRGLVDALIDLKEGFPTRISASLEIDFVAGEDIAQGDALYIDDPTGTVFKAIANNTVDEATVIGFAKETKLTGGTVSVQVAGVLATSGLFPGAFYYLSSVSAGGITSTPPSTPGEYVTRVGEAGNTTQLAIKPELPILLA